MNKFIKLCMFLDICVQYDFNYFKKNYKNIFNDALIKCILINSLTILFYMQADIKVLRLTKLGQDQ